MVSCSVAECKNSTRHGVKMNTVPKDKNRQAQWVKNAGLDITKLSKTLFICEFHFTADMWEKERVDGKKKLKRSAVPTIFGDLVTQIKHSLKDQPAIKSLEPPKQIITTYDTLSNNIIIEEVTERESTTEDTADIILTDDEVDKPIIPDENQLSDSDAEENQLSRSELMQYVKKLEYHLERSEKQVLNLKQSRQRLQNKLRNQIRKNKQLQASLNKDPMKKIFNNDQMEFMNGCKKLPRWSRSTIIKSFKLRLKCGISGYKELIQQNHPLPSLRTLNRCMRNARTENSTDLNLDLPKPEESIEI